MYSCFVRLRASGERFIKRSEPSGSIFPALIAAFALMLPVYSRAEPGDLDLMFGNRGSVVGPGYRGLDGVTSLAQQQDGKVIAAGRAIVRYSTDGAIDTDFGLQGVITAPPLIFTALAITEGGMLLAAGNYESASGDSFVEVRRYDAAGESDRSFGVAGEVATRVGISTGAYAMVVQGDGKLVVGGYTYAGEPQASGMLVLRYTPSGTIDSTFGAQGHVIVPNGGVVRALALQPDGKILAAGYTQNDDQFAIIRVNSDGSIDRGFGDTGMIYTSFGGTVDHAYAMVVQSDGKIVTAGSTSVEGGQVERFALARYNEKGRLDASFGSSGQVITPLRGRARAHALALQPDGRLVAAGQTIASNRESPTGLTSYFAVVRYRSDGQLDRSFGGTGTVTTLLEASAAAQALIVQPDGHLLVAGTTSISVFSTDSLFALVRYIGGLPAGTPTATPNPTSASTPTRSPTPGPCYGDCDENGHVTVDELVKSVTIALGTGGLLSCPAADCNRLGSVTIDCLVRSVNAALNGCLDIARFGEAIH